MDFTVPPEDVERLERLEREAERLIAEPPSKANLDDFKRLIAEAKALRHKVNRRMVTGRIGRA